MKGLIGFLFLIIFIVTVHEGGHLIAAKFFNVYCSEFSIGMGPQLFRKKNKETDFVIRAIPIGGYVSMAGESEDGLEKRAQVDVPKERTIKGIKKWKQIIVYLAGVTMNFISGFIIIVIAVMTISIGEVRVAYVNPSSSAYGILEKGDAILSKDETLVQELENYYPEGVSSIYKIERDGEVFEKIIINDNSEEPFKISYPKVPFVEAIKKAPGIFKNFATAIIDGIKSMLTHPENISGVVGIYSYTSEAVTEGITVYLLLLALININVGVFNLLPLPVMDGGRVAILFVEWFRGKDLDKELETKIMLACAAFLVLLMVWAFGLDIYRLFTGQL